MRTKIESNNVKTFASRGAVRSYMNRLFPSDEVIFIYAVSDVDSRFFPIITGLPKNARAERKVAKENAVTVNTSIKTKNH